ncbi:SDR family oxidoreductase, partial [Thioclava sp. BHET1]
VNYAHSATEAEAVVAEITGAGGRAMAVEADIGTADGLAALFDAGEASCGGVDILVNNAGRMDLSPIADVSDASFDAQIALNLGGVFRGMREAARRLRDGGRIISFSSSVVGLYQPGYGVYAATKAAVEAMTHILAKELAPRGIRVNVVAPGAVQTDFSGGMGRDNPEVNRRVADVTALGRPGLPEDIGPMIAALVSEENRWINAQRIEVSGGMAI